MVLWSCGFRNTSCFQTWDTRTINVGCSDVTFGFLESRRLKILKTPHAEIYLLLSDFFFKLFSMLSYRCNQKARALLFKIQESKLGFHVSLWLLELQGMKLTPNTVS